MTALNAGLYDPSRKRSKEGRAIALGGSLQANSEKGDNMRTSAVATTLSQNRARPIRASAPLILIRRWLTAYRAWRTEQIAIAQLHAMSDHLLRDIGLTRSEIAGS